MFKSIEYVRYDNVINSYSFKLIDTEFECKISEYAITNVVDWAVIVKAVISEYERRGYSHKVIVYNIFKFILFLSNKYKVFCHSKHSSKEENLLRFFKNSNLNDKYYNDLKDMWDKYKMFM